VDVLVSQGQNLRLVQGVSDHALYMLGDGQRFVSRDRHFVRSNVRGEASFGDNGSRRDNRAHLSGDARAGARVGTSGRGDRGDWGNADVQVSYRPMNLGRHGELLLGAVIVLAIVVLFVLLLGH
jgi:hypothetical protein